MALENLLGMGWFSKKKDNPRKMGLGKTMAIGAMLGASSLAYAQETTQPPENETFQERVEREGREERANFLSEGQPEFMRGKDFALQAAYDDIYNMYTDREWSVRGRMMSARANLFTQRFVFRSDGRPVTGFGSVHQDTINEDPMYVIMLSEYQRLATGLKDNRGNELVPENFAQNLLEGKEVLRNRHDLMTPQQREFLLAVFEPDRDLKTQRLYTIIGGEDFANHMTNQNYLRDDTLLQDPIYQDLSRRFSERFNDSDLRWTATIRRHIGERNLDLRQTLAMKELDHNLEENNRKILFFGYIISNLDNSNQIPPEIVYRNEKNRLFFFDM